MNTQQSKDLLFKIMNSIGSPDLFDRELYIWVGFLKKKKSSRFRKWKVRRIPGNCFIFNGKGRISHTLIFPKYNNEYIGIIYRKGTNLDTICFFKSEEEIKTILYGAYMSWIVSTRSRSRILYEDSPENEKNAFFDDFADDLKNSLEIDDENDIAEFKNVLSLICIEDL